MKIGKKDMVIVLLVIALIVVFLSGRSGDESKIVGCWRYVNDGSGRPDITYLEFFSDGTYVSNGTNYDGKYSIDGNRIKLEGVLVKPKVYLFEIKGDVLTLYNYDGDEYPDTYKRDK